MRYWLFKTEPSDYSYSDLEREPAGTVWDGVRNNAALIHLRDVAAGDRALVYHTGRERAAVGIAHIVSDPYPDPRGDDPRFVVVDVQAERRLPRPVTLAELKDDPAFAGHPLVVQGRLSAMEIPQKLWERVLAKAAGD